MSWWSKAWSWFATGRRWMILPAVLAGVVALVGLLRGRRAGLPLPGSVPGAGPAATGDDAEDAREDIRETAAGQAQEVRDRAESDRERIRRAMGRGGPAALLVACLLSQSGCPRPVVHPQPLPALDGICEHGVKACEAAPSEALCGAALACVDAREVGQLCHVRLRECEALAAVDVAEQAALRAAAEARVGELEEQRWWWGVGGLIVGGLAAGLIAGFAR